MEILYIFPESRNFRWLGRCLKKEHCYNSNISERCTSLVVGLALCCINGQTTILDLIVNVVLSCKMVLVNIYCYMSSTVLKTLLGFHYFLTTV